MEALTGRDADGRARHLHLDAEPPERRDDRDEVVRLDVLDDDLAAGRGREADERRDLDVVGADPVVATAELAASR